jgi:hypothetical protein
MLNLSERVNPIDLVFKLLRRGIYGGELVQISKNLTHLLLGVLLLLNHLIELALDLGEGSEGRLLESICLSFQAFRTLDQVYCFGLQNASVGLH